ncbi:MAG TPA: hypothetical protein VFA65_11720 [Bryobacteraceae bacterium]|nr:hypothetical protein [Bryobacteraceae bacterium]
MKRNTAVVVSVLALSRIAAAQDVPRQEVYLGYDMLRNNSATNIPAFTANGAGGQYVLNINSWLGVLGDIYAAHNGNVFGSFTDPRTGITYPGGKLDNTAAFFQFGPRVTIRHWSRVNVFFEMLPGFANGHTSIPVQLPQPIEIPKQPITGACTTNPAACNVLSVLNLRAQTSQNAFAYLLGGGMDIKMGKRMSFRPIQADLQFTRWQNLRDLQNKSQYGFRYSTGFVFNFGSAQ